MSPLSQTSRTLEVDGHLLDTGLMTALLDTVTEGGGTFEVTHFVAGRTRDDRSRATLQVHAPHEKALEEIVAALIDRGARIPAPEETDARLTIAVQDGVAPDDFYATTLYRTEIRVAGAWITAAGQRMDALVVVSAAGSAECRLFRDVRAGDAVVCGVDGIRTFPPERTSAGAGADEFAFMASAVSSERRVEIAVDEIAREMRRRREERGKVVVVAGPVVVHTGGAPHLAALIREGYVHALLGGNAIATHDIELALFGTSLGVHMERGQPVHEGHRHHLRAINLVRRFGSIASAVAAGAVPSGIMAEAVRRGVPFVLAGSIRDDGPLPDTVMDLIEAQRLYQEAIRGADLILMLSSMLHSIGVGNMTPSGVKLVCVDINPAVVTKLADRGSLESVGIVTDVGLFLRLLAGRLGLA
jgi:lysine-ketoglutarate reductase/saccharopine dehydrogenase-like protein (TIGR00300 family)